MPQLFGQTLNNAQRLIEVARLKLKVTGDATGVVVLQDPEAGTSVDPGFTVTATFSIPQTVVPSVYGLTLDDATRRLAGADLQRGNVNDDTADGATVKTQSIAPGTEVSRGTTVDLEVTVPPRPPPTQVPVPNLITRSASDALDTLGRVNLRGPDISRSAEGVVNSQAPAAGNPVDVDTVVNFTLAMPLVNVPYLVQESEDDATKELQAVSLVPNAAHVQGWVPSGIHNVIQQIPSPGSRVPMRSTVSFVVGNLTIVEPWWKRVSAWLWPIAAILLLMAGTALFLVGKIIKDIIWVKPPEAPVPPEPPPPTPPLATCTLVSQPAEPRIGTGDNHGPTVSFKVELRDRTSTGQTSTNHEPAITRKG